MKMWVFWLLIFAMACLLTWIPLIWIARQQSMEYVRYLHVIETNRVEMVDFRKIMRESKEAMIKEKKGYKGYK